MLKLAQSMLRIRPRQMDDLYKTLNVNKNAGKAEIKRAYKKAASKQHPDKPGGDKAKFQQLQRAYDILSDDAKRGEYDSTGEVTGKKSIEEKALNTIVSIFAQIVESMSPKKLRKCDVLSIVKQTVNKELHKSSADIDRLKADVLEIEKTKALMVKDSHHLFANVIDTKIRAIESQINTHEENEKVGHRILEMIKEFEYAYETEPDNVPSFESYFSTAGTSTW